MPVWIIGIIFSLDTITFTITSILLNYINEKSKNFTLIVWQGTLLFVIAMILSGPAPFLPDRIEILCLGILIGGIAGALINNNSVPALNQIIQK